MTPLSERYYEAKAAVLDACQDLEEWRGDFVGAQMMEEHLERALEAMLDVVS
jgi:hypothetical protein